MAEAATYKPIVDKAREFIAYFTEQVEEIWGKEIKNKDKIGWALYGKPTRNHLVFAIRSVFAIGSGLPVSYELHTPIGTIFMKCHWWHCDGYTDELLARLMKRFGLVEIRPYFEYVNGNGEGALYYVPLDLKQPSLEFPLPIASFMDQPQIAYEPRMNVVFRKHGGWLADDYARMKIGDFDQESRASINEAQMLFAEYCAWQDEVSKFDDTIPFSEKTTKAFRVELGFDG